MNRSDSMNLRRDRSFDSVLNKIIRMSSQNQESLKTAMFNFLIVAGIGAMAAVCLILAPFMKPLLWAFLMGAVLFPFKRKLAQLLNRWFERLERRDSNVFLSICLSPLEATEYCGSLLINLIINYWQILVIGSGILGCIKLLFLYVPKGFLSVIWRCIVCSHFLYVNFIGYINIYWLVTIIAVYLTCVHFFWNEGNRRHFIIAGQTLWFVIVGYVSSFFGALQVPVFLLIMTYVGASTLYHLRKREESKSVIENIRKLLDRTNFEKSLHPNVLKKPSLVTSDVEDISLSETIDSMDTLDATDLKEEDTSEHLSDMYFKFLLYACLLTFLYRNFWVVILAAIPMTLHLICQICNITGFSNLIFNQIYDVYHKIKQWALDHHSAVLPLCLPGVLELNYNINSFIRNSLKSSVDLVTSILMIIIMLLIIVFLSVFFCVNIYSETIEVAYLGKDLINKTFTDRPELINILPENMQASLEDALDNAHNYGRHKIETYIDDWLMDADAVHATKLKQQILSVWDRLIQYWIDYNKSDSSYGPRVPTDALKTTFGEIVDNPGHFKELVLVAKQGIIGWARSNTQTILEVGESLWHIIRTNLSMIMSFTGEILSLVLSGGQACVEFILDLIVFFTALFYLLSSSNKKYVPLKITRYLGLSSSGSKIAEALENSISGVLISMFKCSIFTGLFTWLVHTVFGARIVFLPSLLAALLSAAPFLGSYWCAIPALLELWLAQDRFYAGVALFSLQFFVPPYFDAAIYAEMKGGGHPYITGLAIAGGMYWFGWQGAIFGPLMLCFFIGIIEVAAVSMRSQEEARRSSDEETRTTAAIGDSASKILSPLNEEQGPESLSNGNESLDGISNINSTLKENSDLNLEQKQKLPSIPEQSEKEVHADVHPVKLQIVTTTFLPINKK